MKTKELQPCVVSTIAGNHTTSNSKAVRGGKAAEVSRAKAPLKLPRLERGITKLVLLVCHACLACFLPSVALAQAQYAGTYSGTYSGDESGTWTGFLDSTGNGTGYAIAPWGRADGVGHVLASGSLLFAFGSVDTGATFTGQIDPSGYAHGTWVNSFYGMRGTFSGHRRTSPSTSAKVTISSPKANSRLTDSWLTVVATATSTVGIDYVEVAVSNAWSFDLLWQPMYQLDSGAWEGGVDLSPGPNSIFVRATDWSGVVSPVVAVKVTYIVSYPVWLTVDPPNGGKVSGVTNGAMLEVGKQYTVKATPNNGYLFSHWTFFDPTVASTTFKFTMPPQEMYLYAIFAPNPFAGYAGSYSALYQFTDDPQSWTKSGLLNLVLTDNGMASGKITSAGVSYSFSRVQFDPLSLSATFQVKRGTSLPPLRVEASFGGADQGQAYLNGGVYGEEWFVLFSTGRRSSVSALVGTYTFGLQVDPLSPEAGVVGGIGAGTITVDQKGGVRLAGNLGDGTPVTLSSQIALDGSWPIYIPLYGRQGVLAGQGSFMGGSPTATLYWLKPSRPADKYYPEGFNTEYLNLSGAKYTAPGPGQPVIAGWTSGSVELGAGNLADVIQNEITFNNNRLTVSNNSEKLRLAITASSGRFTGSFTDPTSLKSRSIKGVIIQQDLFPSYGIGWFLGTNESGYVWLGQYWLGE